MKKLVSLQLVCLMLLVFNASFVEAATLRKTWKYGSSEQGKWVYQYHDASEGENYQCLGSGLSCGLYDWMAVYHLGVAGQDPNPHINTPEYGHNLVVQAVGSLAPSYLPTFEKATID